MSPLQALESFVVNDGLGVSIQQSKFLGISEGNVFISERHPLFSSSLEKIHGNLMEF